VADNPTPPSVDGAGSSAYESSMLGFCREALQESDAFLRATEGYSKIVETMKAISGVYIPIRPTWLSHTSDNEIGRLASIIRAELTDIKPAAAFKTHNPEMEQKAVNMGKMWTSWYLNNAVDQKYGGVIDYALAGGSGVGHQIWNKFTRDIDIIPYDIRDALPVRPIGNDFQSAMGCILRQEMTVNAVRAMFPHKSHLISADRDGTAVKLQETTRTTLLQSIIQSSPFQTAQATNQPAKRLGAAIPVVDLFYFYVNDHDLNTSSMPVQVGDFRPDGEPANNWSYIVQPDQPLYPRKRLIIFTRRAVLYDGPNIYWHGMFPVSKLTLDPWQWTWLGKSPLWDCLPLQDSLNKALRAVDDHIQKSLRPHIYGDKTSIGESEIEEVAKNWLKPGVTWRQNPSGKGVQVGEVPALDPAVDSLIKFCISKMESLAGVQDMGSVLDLNQIPEGNTIEKMISAMRPEIRSRSRNLEVFFREQGKMYMYNAAQFYTARRKFAILGPEGIGVEEFDFDPSTFIPHTYSNDPRPRQDVAREHLQQFEFFVAPSSLLKASHTADQMMYMMLFTQGAMDVQTLLERLDVPNVQQILTRLQKQMEMKAQMASAMSGDAGSVVGGRNGSAPPDGGGGSDDSGPGGPMGGHPQGRKPTFQQPPHMNGGGKMSTS
jgi:hypothetical protein